MLSLRPLLFTLALTVASPPMALGQPWDLDLAEDAPGSARTFRVKPGETLDLRVVNRLPGKTYTISAQVDFIPIAAFTLDGFRGAQKETAPADETFGVSKAESPECASALQKLLNTSEEKKILETFADHPDCEVLLQPHLSESLGSYELAAGEVLTVDIERAGNTWSWTFTTGARGEWRTTYGFTFVPNEDRKYVTRPGRDGNAGKFVIFEQKDREELDFVPSVLFNWLPAKQRGQNWVDGFTAGLGWDLEKPVVFAGWSWMYNENLNVTVGAAIHQQTQLLGRYDVKGDSSVVGEALESTQLVETTYGPNFYIGVGFRFDRNNDPFARSAALREKSAQAEETRLKNAAAAEEAKKKAAELQKACEAEAARVRAEADKTCDSDFDKSDQAAEATAQRDKCKRLAETTETAAKAKCPAEVTQSLLAEQARNDCRALAASSFAVATDSCEKTKREALDAAETARKTAFAACPGTNKDTCEAKATSDFEAAKTKAVQTATECLNTEKKVRDETLVKCNK